MTSEEKNLKKLQNIATFESILSKMSKNRISMYKSIPTYAKYLYLSALCRNKGKTSKIKLNCLDLSNGTRKQLELIQGPILGF